MTRVKRGNVSRKRHKKVLKLAKGYFGSKSKLYRPANEQVMKSGAYAYAHRRLKKRDFRQLWIARINAAVRAEGLTYSQFIHKLAEKNIDLNRKVLANLAMNEPETFTKLVKSVK